MVLIEPDKPLESGVELMIHPPGKKLTRLSLLSGGEKALSAIAFIFSIFLIKPASFCLLDEIDAPLDDANVFRFNDLLQIIGENSQIIVVTHNKRTMEFADMLFGITMEQKGISKVVSVNFLKKDEAANECGRWNQMRTIIYSTTMTRISLQDLLQIIGENSQIVVITHNKRTMEFADMLFGITMEQRGISKVVSVNFLQISIQS